MMNRFARLAAAFSIFLAAFGAAPTAAVAQAFTARAAAVSAATSAAGSAASVTAALPAALTAPALGTLSISAPSAQVLPSAAPSAAALSLAPAFAAAPAAAPAPVHAAPAALAAAPAPVSAAPAAVRVLRDGAARLGESAPSAGVSVKSAELDALYSGSAVRSAAEADAAPALSASRASALAAASGPRWVFRPETPAPSKPAPRTTLKRSLAVGYLTGLAGMAFTAVSTILISLTGWAPHGNYQSPFENMQVGLGAAVAMFLGAVVLAPMAEEVIFRGALQGGLSKLSTKLKLGAFAVPAVLTSLVFVAVHETADPVLFAVRFGFAFMLSRVFHKEGVLSSMTAHGTFNGVAAASIVLSAAHVPLIGEAAVVLLAAVLAVRAWRLLKAEKPEIAAGTLAPKPFTAKQALLIIPTLFAGFLFIMPNLFWLAGMAFLIFWLIGRKLAAFAR